MQLRAPSTRMATVNHNDLQRIIIFLIIFTVLATVLLSIIALRGSYFDGAHAHGQEMEPTKFSGDAYHSPEVFRLDYGEMERKFRVYVYPDTDHHEATTKKHEFWEYFLNSIKGGAFLTRDPQKAHLFFIPVSCQKLHQKVKSEEQYAYARVSPYEDVASDVEKFVERLTIIYPYWNKTLGADHFFLTCHEIEVGATERVPFMIKNAIRVVVSSSYATGFIPRKDVSLPSVMHPSAKYPIGDTDIARRTILGYWAGACNSETRKTLVKLWGKDDELDIQNFTAKYTAAGMNKFHRAKFCICPVGSRATSNRILKAIHYGCVPVIMVDYYDLPFNDILDWKKFSVILRERDVYNLKAILKAKAGADYRMLHGNLLEVQQHFRWNACPVKFDMFHMVLYELWLRRNVVRY